MVVLSDFPYTSALFGLVMFHDPWKDHRVPSWERVHIPTKPGFSRIFILHKMPSGDMDSFPAYLWRTVRSHNSKFVDDSWKVRQKMRMPILYPWRIHGIGIFTCLYMKTIKINHSCIAKYTSPMDPSWVSHIQSMYLPKFQRWKWSASTGSSLNSLYAKTKDDPPGN